MSPVFCPCDEFVHPLPLHISAGLSQIPRQIATFPEFRRAMLKAIARYPALLDWRARSDEDLGVMLLEMWAYVCDSGTFYDEVIAHENYVRTAYLQPSLRKLVYLLGYIPRPAVAASAHLAAIAEGRKPVLLSKGTAFRSGAFDGNPPQVFELTRDTQIHILNNQWTLDRQPPTTLGSGSGLVTLSKLSLHPSTAKVKRGDILLIRVEGDMEQTYVRRAIALTTTTDLDRQKYLQVSLNAALTLPANTPLDQIQISTPSQTASLWRLGSVGPISGAKLTLDGLYRQIKPDQLILIAKGTEFRWFQVVAVDDTTRDLPAGAETVIKDDDGNVIQRVEPPPIPIPVTELNLDASVNGNARKASGAASWGLSDANQIVVHYGFTDAGTVIRPLQSSVTKENALHLREPVEYPPSQFQATQFLLEDKNQRGLYAKGNLNPANAQLTLNEDTVWEDTLTQPIQVYGNVLQVTRGETVADEILGSGDAAVANQSFTLSKKPLTYVTSPTADNVYGIASTLEIFVNAIRWQEVPRFFGVAPDAQVYIVRQTDEGESVVTFGDGIRGARVPTGIDNIVAYYRFGAGEASPPDGSINQIVTPKVGLKSVQNIVAAEGGADAESAEGLRTYAPRSALLLGRVVSMADMAAATASIPGVRATQTEWRWSGRRQRAVAQIYYIGAATLQPAIAQTLRTLMDPATPIEVVSAQAVPAHLSLDIEIDARYQPAPVLEGVQSMLLANQRGLLVPERIGIGQPLYRSRIFEAVLSVDGAIAIQGISWNFHPFIHYGIRPGAGRYFDLEQGSLRLNGQEVTHG